MELNKEAIDWWKSQPIYEKVDYKKRFEVYRKSKEVVKLNYPDMYDLSNVRISQLSEKHIIRMWEFKDEM